MVLIVSFVHLICADGQPSRLNLRAKVDGAMMMENILRAVKAATVKATPVKAGESVAVDQIIIEFE